jgi:ABC-2 type transport system ATP-binding protein
VIETRGLRKSFPAGKAGRVEAVRGVDLDVHEAEIFGFLGPNGAGKTTTLRMLTTLLEPDGGDATIAGVDVLRDAAGVRRVSGYVAQGGGTSGQLTAREELVQQARMYGIAKTEALARAEEAVTAFELTEFADRHCSTYSGGQRRRLDIALGVIHRPRVLFLDEPTVGLDPQSRARLWDEVRRLRDAERMTVFLTTHYLDEADALCDRVAIIDHGEIVAEGTPLDLKRDIAGDVVTLAVEGPTEAAEELLRGVGYVRRLETSQKGLLLYVDDASTAIPQILRALDGSGVEFGGMELNRPTLDDVFLTKTGRLIRES